MEGKYLSLAQVGRQLPGTPSPSSIWRWCRKGIKSRSGERIHLKHLRIGGRMFVCESDLQSFFEAVAKSDLEYFDRDQEIAPLSVPHVPTSRQREREIARAERSLREAGVIK